MWTSASVNTVLYHFGFAQTNLLRRKVVSVTVDKWSHLLLLLLYYLCWKMMKSIGMTSQGNQSVFLLLQGSFWRYSERACTCMFLKIPYSFVPTITSVDLGLSGPSSWCDIQLPKLDRQLPGHRMSEQARQAQPAKCVVHRYVLVVLRVWENWHIQQHSCSLCWCYICANKKNLANIICVSTSGNFCTEIINFFPIAEIILFTVLLPGNISLSQDSDGYTLEG